MARRTYKLAHGEGTFYRRQGGQWVGSLQAGWSERGTRKRITVTSRDKAAAWDKLMAAKKQLAITGTVATTSPTVKAWSADWLEHHADRMRPQSRDQHRARLQKWVVPAIGHKRLHQLTPGDLRAIHKAIRDAGRSASTVRAVHSTIKTLLSDAVTEGHQVPDPVRNMRRPAEGISDRDAIAADDAILLARYLTTDRPDAARWVAALLQGMRQAECLGLRWQHVDLAGRTLDVSWQLVRLRYADYATRRFDIPPDQEAVQLAGAAHLMRPKSKAGSRVIPLVPWMHDALVRWREVAPPSPHGLVWPGPNGRPQNADEDRRAWYRILQEAGVSKPNGQPYKLHEARHTTASLLAAAGVHIEVVGQILGHGSVSMSRLYTHAQQPAMRAALEAGAQHLQLD